CLILFAYPFILTDCYDGSDEYDSNISYQNTCFQNGNNNMTRTFSSEVIARDKEDKVTLEELIERLRGNSLCVGPLLSSSAHHIEEEGNFE
ncbi:hypothetical protein GIB67_003423, partial [Kingdonia uniflora]